MRAIHLPVRRLLLRRRASTSGAGRTARERRPVAPPARPPAPRLRSCGDCCSFCLLSLCCMECCVAKGARRQIRDHFGLKADGCCGSGDCCTHLCCTRCSLCQERRELNVRRLRGAGSWGRGWCTEAVQHAAPAAEGPGAAAPHLPPPCPVCRPQKRKQAAGAGQQTTAMAPPAQQFMVAASPKGAL